MAIAIAAGSVPKGTPPPAVPSWSAPPVFTSDGTSTPARRPSPERDPRQSPRQTQRARGALLTKRPSIVTGGYETSDSSEDDDVPARPVLPKKRPFPSGYGEASSQRPPSFSYRPPRDFPQAYPQGGRRRAKTMVTSVDEEAWTTRQRNRLRQGSKDRLRSSPAHSPLGPNGPVPPQVPYPSSRPASKSPDKKGKGRTGNLAASLGLEPGIHGDVSLTPEQVLDLLNNSQVGNALRVLNNQPAPSWPAANPSPLPLQNQRQESPAPAEPFVARAPPPLTGGDDYPAARRLRQDSVASSIVVRPSVSSISTVGSPLQRQSTAWPQGTLAADPETLALRRRRASSRIETEGGHVPFTHHIPAPRLEEEPIDNILEESPLVAEPEDTLLNRTPSVHTPSTSSTNLPSPSAKKNGMPRSRFSQLFHPRKHASSKDLATQSPNGHSTHHPSKEDRAKDAVLREQARQREREKIQQDIERRRIEQERRENELAQERRYHVLTQINAHPESERRAYRTSCHLRAFYSHIYDGLETPPRLNPLAILRFKHKTKEQTEARQRWERIQKQGSQSQVWDETSSGRARPLDSANARPAVPRQPAAGWQYSVADIDAYKDANGVVNYFVPPRQPIKDDDDEKEEADGSSSLKPELGPAEEGSSVAGSLSKRPLVLVRDHSVADGPYDTSRSVPSVRSGPSFISQEYLSLSRSPSTETRALEHGLSHQKHHSLGSLGPQTLTHALKAPFEKLGSVTKRHRGDATMWPTEDEVEQPAHRSPPSLPGSQRKSHYRVNDTNEDESHLAKLFLKNQRSGGARLPGTELPARIPNGQEPQVRIRETDSADPRRDEARRQKEEEAMRIARAEEEAKAQAEEVERRVYAERKAQMEKAEDKLAKFNTTLDQFDERMRHSLSQADQIAAVSKTSAEIDAEFPDIDSLRLQYLNRNRAYASDPVGTPTASARSSSIDGRKPPLKQNSMAKRRLSNAASTLYMLGIRPLPRRFSLDPKGRMRVDPFQRAALTIDNGREQITAMLARRDETVGELRAMIGQIDALIKQKDSVRSWTKTALEDIRARRHTLDGLKAELAGNTAAKLRRIVDQITDRAIRTFISPPVKVFLYYYQFWRWFASRRSAKKRSEYGRRKVVSGVSWTCILFSMSIVVFLAAAYWADAWIAWVLAL